MCLARREAGEVLPAPALTGLSEGLHLLSQPLSILRARLSAELLDEMDAAQVRESAERCGVQVERMCQVVETMKRLLDLLLTTAECGAVDAAELVADVVDGVGLVLDDQGIELVCELPEPGVMMTADRERMRQALTEALLLGCGVSAAKDRLALSVAVAEESVRLTLRNGNSGSLVLGAMEQIALAAVETCVSSQGGAVQCSLRPFVLRMELQLAAIALKEWPVCQ